MRALEELFVYIANLVRVMADVHHRWVPIDWASANWVGWLYLAAMIGVVALVRLALVWTFNKLTGGKLALWNSKSDQGVNDWPGRR